MFSNTQGLVGNLYRITVAKRYPLHIVAFSYILFGRNFINVYFHPEVERLYNQYPE